MTESPTPDDQTDLPADRRTPTDRGTSTRPYSRSEAFWLHASRCGVVFVGFLGIAFLCFAVLEGKTTEDAGGPSEPSFPTAVRQPDFPEQPSGHPGFQTAELAPTDGFLPLEDLIEQIEPSVVRIDVSDGTQVTQGSGFLVDELGTIVTNDHVISQALTAQIVFPDGWKTPVLGTVYRDPQRDIALLRAELPVDRIRPLRLSMQPPRKGETVIAYGSPFGLSFTASQGIVSAIRSGRELVGLGIPDQGTWVQTTTPISPGSSGGPLINLRGEVIAANTMQVDDGQNLNFGISAYDLHASLAEMSVEVSPLGRSPQRKPVPRIADLSGTPEGQELLSRVRSVRLRVRTVPGDPVRPELRDLVAKEIGIRGLRVNEESPATLLIAIPTAITPDELAWRLDARLLIGGIPPANDTEPTWFLLWEGSGRTARGQGERYTASELKASLDNCLRELELARRTQPSVKSSAD